MCDRYVVCTPAEPELIKPKPKAKCKPKIKRKEFTPLFLDCWQREYDERPYKNFKLKVLDFEERMGRKFHPIKDFAVIIEFLHNRPMTNVSITGINTTTKLELQKSFASGLLSVYRLELRLMTLPDCFFDQLLTNVDQMYLKELILEGTEISPIAVSDLRLFLISAKHLRYLNVNSCNIDQFNFNILADGVHKSSSLRRFEFNRLIGGQLSLDSFRIGQLISSLILQNKLEQISMEKCELDGQDMENIAQYLWKKCSNLRQLSVACNLIGSDGATHLFSAISNSGTLTDLNLSHCSLGSHGGDVVAKYLCSCFKLESLNIRFNDIDADTMNNILTMMKKRIKTLSLKVFGNDFDSKSGKILDRLLKSGVLPQSYIDVTSKVGANTDSFFVVPYD